MVPVVVLPPSTPFTSQLTAGAVPVDVTENCCVAPARTITLLGEIPKPEAAVMVTTADSDAVLSACETAATVTIPDAGMVDGAWYRPEVEMVPTLAFPPAVPLTCQLTVVFVVP